ncbi:MAG: hypothetical protein VB050_03755 [Geobacteraceae bacterium]|nr:hypothetical protein [Geobacteraceae bacterium]
MNTKKLVRILFTVITLILLCTDISFATPLEKIRFIKTSPRDETAVIKEANGKLKVIRPGDRIGDKISVTAISKDRIILEEKTDKGPETVIVRIGKDGQSLERISKQCDVKPLLGMPDSKTKTAPAARK